MTNRQVVSITIILFCSIALFAISLQTGDGEAGALEGASLMPNIAVGLMFSFTLLDLMISLLQRRRVSAKSDGEFDDAVNWGKHQWFSILAVSGVLTFFSLIMKPAGYIMAGFLMVAAIMLIAGGRNLVKIVLIAFVATVVLYVGLHFGFGISINAFPMLFF